MVTDGGKFVVSQEELLRKYFAEKDTLSKAVEVVAKNREILLDAGETEQAQEVHNKLVELRRKLADLPHKHYTFAFGFTAYSLHESRSQQVCQGAKVVEA